jgi:hypothetical protein
MADDRELKIVTTVSNQIEAEMVCGRLTDAGIRSMQQASERGGQWNPGVPYNVLVREQDFDRARATLDVGESTQPT